MIEPDYKALGAFLKGERDRRGVSLEELSNLSGVTIPALKRLEKGFTGTTKDFLKVVYVFWDDLGCFLEDLHWEDIVCL